MDKIIHLIKIKFTRLILILRTLLTGPQWTTCSICQKRTFFYEEGFWPREKYHCVRCGSIPRWRALFQVLEKHIPQWSHMAIHESSPYGSLSKKLRENCSYYTPTYFFPHLQSGTYYKGFRCENLEDQSFPDQSFDIIITQDVLEHVSDPQKVCREIHRTLKKGGKHIFTIPRDDSKPSEQRVKFIKNEMIHLKESIYHGNPIDNKGSLVVTDWGNDVCELIFQWTGMKTEIVLLNNGDDTIDENTMEVFVSSKDL